ncbi:MAG: hypothetical protein E7576_04900 [Ruminococcaceae bacterium]|jgi:hypothetical protein|nr:hypothetical protein [Oscillospiraceae bacterium]
MKPIASRVLTVLLCALLLSSCAVNLRPSDPFSDAETVPTVPDVQSDQNTPDPVPEPDQESETEAEETESAETDPPESPENGTEEPETEPNVPETAEPEAHEEAGEPETRETEARDPEPEKTDPPEPEQSEPEAEPEPDPEPSAEWTFGTREGDVWRNEAAGVRFVLPGDDWIFAGEAELDAANRELPEGTLYDMQAVSEAGSSVLVMARRVPDPEDGEEPVTLAEYAAILSDGMTESGGEEASIRAGEPETADFAGSSWLRVEYGMTWFGTYESRSVWYTREEDGWFLTVAVTASPADWLDADGILSMLTAADVPLPVKPEKPAEPEPEPPRFRWGSDSVENGVYRNEFAGITVRAADGWTFMSEKELAKRNDLHVAADADSAAIAEAEDKENARCVMRLSSADGAAMELSFIRLDTFGAEGDWEKYASFLAESLIESGEKAGFTMSATDGEWAEMAGQRWFARIVTFSSGGYAVGQQMLLWRPVGGELAELTLDNGVWTDRSLSSMLSMIGTAE